MSTLAQTYRQPLVGRLDAPLRNSLYGAGAVGMVVLLAALLAPPPPAREARLEEIPERYAKLILEKPAPVIPPAPEAERPAPRTQAPANPVARPEVAVQPKPEPRQRRRSPEKPAVAPDRGVEGRRRAETEVKAELARVTGSLDQALDQLATALPAAGEGDEKAAARRPQRRRRGTRGGRDSGQLAAAAGVTNLQGADLGGTALRGQAVAIAGISDLVVADGSAVDDGTESGASGRSSESLLAVVRKYAPGIQFCYENELKRTSGLRGKLVVGITVLPDGTVADVVVVEDTLDSGAVTDCAVSQMRGWQFPAADGAASTFRAPFVFTPPDA